jgi:hypothetical protein
MRAVESLKRDDAIYLAGLFDGEGCAQFKRRMETKRKGKRYNCMIISLELSMTDEKTVRHLHDKVKVGTVNLNRKNRSPSSKPHYKDQYRWRCSYRDANFVAKLLYPYAITKKKILGEIINHLVLKD